MPHNRFLFFPFPPPLCGSIGWGPLPGGYKNRGLRQSRGFRLSAPPTAVFWPPLCGFIQNSKIKIQNSFFVGVSLPSEHFADAVNGCDEGVDLGLGVVEREGGADGALYA